MASLRKSLSSAWHTLFGDPVRAFGVVSVVLLIALAVAPAKDFFSEWRGYQRGYLSFIRDRADAVTLRRHFAPGIQQIWLPELGVVDRCTTCHEGLKEASLVDVSTQPFRRHPVDPAFSHRLRLCDLSWRPGSRDDRRRSPFQHRAGELLDPSCPLHRGRLRTVPSERAGRERRSSTRVAGSSWRATVASIAIP